MHTLRAPDVGNRIDEGRLPQILLESLPPLHEEALTRAGEQLDGLTETRAAQQRLEDSARQVTSFLGVYQRYAADTLRSRANETMAAAGAVTEAVDVAGQRAGELAALEEEAEQREAAARQLAEELAEIDDALKAIEKREIFKTADDLVQRDRAVVPAPRRSGRTGPGCHHPRTGQSRPCGRRRRAAPWATSGRRPAMRPPHCRRPGRRSPRRGCPAAACPQDRHGEHTGSPRRQLRTTTGNPQPVPRPPHITPSLPADISASPASPRRQGRPRGWAWLSRLTELGRWRGRAAGAAGRAEAGQLGRRGCARYAGERAARGRRRHHAGAGVERLTAAPGPAS